MPETPCNVIQLSDCRPLYSDNEYIVADWRDSGDRAARSIRGAARAACRSFSAPCAAAARWPEVGREVRKPRGGIQATTGAVDSSLLCRRPPSSKSVTPPDVPLLVVEHHGDLGLPIHTIHGERSGSTKHFTACLPRRIALDRSHENTGARWLLVSNLWRPWHSNSLPAQAGLCRRCASARSTCASAFVPKDSLGARRQPQHSPRKPDRLKIRLRTNHTA